MFGCQQEDNAFCILDFIKKPPGTDSIPPGLRIKTFEFFYVGSKMRVLSQLWIDELSQLLRDLRLARQSNLLQVFLELFSFKYSIKAIQ